MLVNNLQQGPYALPQLQQMVQQGILLPATLVWKQGMPQWQAASTCPELAGLFGMTPPPLLLPLFLKDEIMSRRINLFADYVLPLATIVVTIVLFFLFCPEEETALFYVNMVYTVVLETIFLHG